MSAEQNLKVVIDEFWGSILNVLRARVLDLDDGHGETRFLTGLELIIYACIICPIWSWIKLRYVRMRLRTHNE